MSLRYYQGDLPQGAHFGEVVAIDTETMGLNLQRDRLCVVQLSRGDGSADIVQIARGQRQAPNLVKLLQDSNVTKLFHFGRFDIAALYETFSIVTAPVYCTKIASKLARTNSDRHGLKDLVRELLGVEISKQQQTSDWGVERLNEAQLSYAASDVLYLHEIRNKLDIILARENRKDIAQSCFDFLPQRAKLDIMGWQDVDIFAHM